MASFRPCALQRLQRDLKELHSEPLPGIELRLDPSNIGLMCLLITPLEGPLSGLCLHLSVSIPPSYPHDPPQVSIETCIYGHPNIIGSYICCDILRPRSQWEGWDDLSTQRSDHYMGGYTPAYLLKYLFLQLLTFFSAPQIEQEYNAGFASHLRSCGSYSDNFTCGKCGFDTAISRKGFRLGDEMVSKTNHEEAAERGSELEEEMETRGSGKPGVEDSGKYGMLASVEADGNVSVHSPLSPTDAVPTTLNQDYLHILHDHVWLIIFNYLSDQDLVNLARASPTVVGDVLQRYNVRLRRELVCFFTRKTFKEALLGVGVRLEDVAHVPNAPPRRVLHIEAFDMLSLEAFEAENVREGIFGHMFTHFLPLGLDDNHFARALPLLPMFLADSGLTPDLSSTGFFYVIPKLMNTMIVNMMKECDTPVASDELCTGDELSEADVPKKAVLQASEKAFKGYCLLFHLLMKLSRKFPHIKLKAQEKLTLFCTGKGSRNKKNIPDLGEFVAVLPLVLEEGYDWATLCSALVEELLTRNVLWVLKEKPDLAELGKDGTSYYIPARRRLQDSFKVSRTGLRLMMLQANFMRALVQWRNKLDESYGFPPCEMTAHLVQLVKRIYVVQGGKRDPYSAWKDFFTILQYEPIPSMLETVEMLKTAILDSKNKGYHRDGKLLGQKQALHNAHRSIQQKQR